MATDEAVAARGGSRQRLARELRGDLELIAARALRKLPAERYASADALAQDLYRYRHHEPIHARAHSNFYRLRRFAQRHHAATAAASVSLASLLIAVGISLWQAHEAREQRDRALALSARNEAVVDFVTNMLIEVAPADQPMRVADLLDRSREILMSHRTAPEHQAAILALLSNYFLSMGDPARAQPMLERALDLTSATADAALRAGVLCDGGFAEAMVGRTNQGIGMIERGLAVGAADPFAAARCLQKRAFIAQNANDAAGALKYAVAAQQRLQASSVARPDQEAALLADVAFAHYLNGHTQKADHYYAASLRMSADLGRAERPSTFTVHNNRAIARFAAGDTLNALRDYDNALRIATRGAIDGQPPAYLISNRALARGALARYEEALAAYEVAIAAARRSGNTGTRLHAFANRAGTYLAMGRVDDAEVELEHLLDDPELQSASDSSGAIALHAFQGRLAALRGRHPEAVNHFTEVIRFFQERGMEVMPLARTLMMRADVLMHMGKIEAARSDATHALAMAKKFQGDNPHSSVTGQALLQLSRIEVDTDASRAREFAAQAVQHLEPTLGADHPETRHARTRAHPQA